MNYPKAGDEDYRRLRIVLDDGEWHNQDDIEKHDASLVGVKVRQICSQHPTEFLGNVNYGYRLVEHATKEEIDWAVRSLRSRARKITKRADALEKINGGPLQGDMYD
jgi:hypothetical protein